VISLGFRKKNRDRNIRARLNIIALADLTVISLETLKVLAETARSLKGGRESSTLTRLANLVTMY
jgi:hypothetical protein